MAKGLTAVVLLVSLIIIPIGCLAQAGKVEQLGPLTDPKVPEAVRAVLDSKGYRATLADGTVACEIWLRKNVPAHPGTGDTTGAVYPQLAESELVGVISFPAATTDYKGQAIPSGWYTLRYELLPNNGDHLGVAPDPDFLLLIPAAADTDPTAEYKFDPLVELSRQATGTKHPGPLNMAQANGTTPAVSKDDENHWVFSAGLMMSSGNTIPFGLVVKGTAPQ